MKENRLDVLAHIPYDEELGKINSQGMIVSRENPKYGNIFKDILKKIMKEARSETASHTKR
jgi:CO dehydrogenase nickel-insertion accessory protein CooC1